MGLFPGANAISILLGLCSQSWPGQRLLRPPVEFEFPGISDTHPGLLEAVGPPAVIGVLGDVLGLLELLPQPLYPVVVARS